MGWSILAGPLIDIGLKVLGKAVSSDAEAIGRKIGETLGVTTPEQAKSTIETYPEQCKTTLGSLESDPAVVAAYYDAMKEQVVQMHETQRMELASPDKYVSRARPTFVYAIILVWALLGLAIVWLLVTSKISDLDTYARFLGALETYWYVALAATGVFFWTRSKEKRTAMTGQEGGLLGAVLDRMK